MPITTGVFLNFCFLYFYYPDTHEELIIVIIIFHTLHFPKIEIDTRYMQFCKRFEDAVPVKLSTKDAKGIIQHALNKDIDDVFDNFSDEPVGSASIGQVYKATMKNGKNVAVKVMVPGLEPLFRSDIATLKSFCQLAMPQHVPALEEIEKQFLTEFDYKREALNLKGTKKVSVIITIMILKMG